METKFLVTLFAILLVGVVFFFGGAFVSRDRQRIINLLCLSGVFTSIATVLVAVKLFFS